MLIKTKHSRLDKILWSIAFPGFGQLLNRKIIKGLSFIVLEITINVKAKLNEIIIASFQGNIEQAIRLTNYQWLMFYPCIYMFAIYDAYCDSMSLNKLSSINALPCALAAYFATVGVIYSSSFKFLGVLLGPVWLPMIGCFFGLGSGWLLSIMIHYKKEPN